MCSEPRVVVTEVIELLPNKPPPHLPQRLCLVEFLHFLVGCGHLHRDFTQFNTIYVPHLEDETFMSICT